MIVLCEANFKTIQLNAHIIFKMIKYTKSDKLCSRAMTNLIVKFLAHDKTNKKLSLIVSET